MATADLGIRIFLSDNASPGFMALGTNLGSMTGQLMILAMRWNTLSDTQQAWASKVVGAEMVFRGFSSALETAIQDAGDLQASLIQLSINVQGADARSQDMMNTLINVADYSVYTAQQVADGFVLIGQKGYDAADIIDNKMGQSMVNLAESINTETVPAANLLSSAMRTWHADAKDATYYTNALSFAFHNGVPDVSGLQQAIMQAGAQAVSVGMPFKQFVLLLDNLGRAGLSGSQAATSLRYMLASLTNPTAKAAEEMAHLGVIIVQKTSPALKELLDRTNAFMKNPLELTGTLKDLNELYTTAQKVGTLHTDKSFLEWATGIGAVKNNLFDAKGNFQGLNAVIDVLGPKLAGLNTSQDFDMAIENLFNVRGGKGAQALLNNLGFTTKQIREMSSAYDQYIKQDGARKAADKTTSGSNATFKELAATFHDFAAQIGLPLLGPLISLGKHLNDFLNDMRAHHPTIRKFIAIFLVVGTVLSGIVLVVVLVGAAIALLGAPLAMVGAVVGAIIGVSLAIAGVVANVHKLTAVGAAIGTFFNGVWSGILKLISNLLHTLSHIPLIGGMFGAAANAFDGLTASQRAATAESEKFKNATLASSKAALEANTRAIKSGEDRVKHAQQEARSLETEMSHTTNAAKRAALEKRLGVVREQAQEATEQVKKAQQQRTALSHEYDLMRVKALDATVKKNTAIVKEDDAYIAKAKAQLKTTTSDAAKAYLEKRIKVLEQSKAEHLATVKHAEDQKNGILKHMGETAVQAPERAQVAAKGVESKLGQMKDVGIQLVKDLVGGILDWMGGLPGKMLGLGISIVQNLAKGIRDHIGDIKNVLMNGLKSIPGVGGIISGGQSLLSHIPGLAAGGVVTRPTLALIGEGREPEVVLPVSKLAAFMENYKSAGSTVGGGTIVVPLVIDGTQVAGVVVDRVTGQIRQLGGGRMFR